MTDSDEMPVDMFDIESFPEKVPFVACMDMLSFAYIYGLALNDIDGLGRCPYHGAQDVVRINATGKNDRTQPILEKFTYMNAPFLRSYRSSAVSDDR